MSEKREPGFDRALAQVLHAGALSGFFVMAAGTVAQMDAAAVAIQNLRGVSPGPVSALAIS